MNICIETGRKTWIPICEQNYPADNIEFRSRNATSAFSLINFIYNEKINFCVEIARVR